MRIGLISDTHGLLRPEAIDFLRGSDVIVHAGDIGSPEVLERLAELAPVTAVRGNNDREHWARRIPDTDVLNAAGVGIYVLHDFPSSISTPHRPDTGSSCSAIRTVRPRPSVKGSST